MGSFKLNRAAFEAVRRGLRRAFFRASHVALCKDPFA